MAYLAIYRRFRPKTFGEMIGQEQIVKTLVNQIKSGRIGHAYLFCGARGTGKTTAAKIFARAINCERPINGSPCGECPVCKSLADPANLDISEIDAASNNKVDDVREIRDKVQYPPVNGKYKVYIIDEVHMLSTEAFNALLKTLEEPPEHAVFILATTEPQKLPATILSRCMRFDFKLVADGVIAELIKKIYDEIGKKYEEEAVMKIAASGEGSVRDALSVADLCVSYSDDILTYRDVLEVLGASDVSKTAEIAENILKSQTGGALQGTANLLSSGKSVGLLCKDLSGYVRNLIVAKTCGNAKEILSCPDSEVEELRAVAAFADEHRLLRILEIFAKTENDLKYSTHPRVILETAILKAAQPQEDYNLDSVISRLAALESKIKDIGERGALPTVDTDNRKNGESRISESNSACVDGRAEEAASDCNDTKQSCKDKISETQNSANIENKSPASDTNEKFFESEQAKLHAQAERSVKENEAKKASEKKPAVNIMSVWGTVVRKLRADKNIMLWIVCQDAEPIIKGENLVVYVMGDNEYDLLSKQDNIEILQAIVNTMCNLKVQIALKTAGADPFDEDVAKAEDILGNVDITD